MSPDGPAARPKRKIDVVAADHRVEARGQEQHLCPSRAVSPDPVGGPHDLKAFVLEGSPCALEPRRLEQHAPQLRPALEPRRLEKQAPQLQPAQLTSASGSGADASVAASPRHPSPERRSDPAEEGEGGWGDIVPWRDRVCVSHGVLGLRSPRGAQEEQAKTLDPRKPPPPVPAGDDRLLTQGDSSIFDISVSPQDPREQLLSEGETVRSPLSPQLPRRISPKQLAPRALATSDDGAAEVKPGPNYVAIAGGCDHTLDKTALPTAFVAARNRIREDRSDEGVRLV